MKFAKIVFWAAGIWGVLILTPLFFIFNSIGRNDPPPVTQLSSCPDQSFIRPGTTSCVARDLPDARIAQVHSGSRCL